MRTRSAAAQRAHGLFQYPGPYRVPCSIWTAVVWTNTGGRCAYRGPWQMESVAREQMLEHCARELGIDPLELRRRNVLHRSELPYTSAGGNVIENVSPEECFESAAERDRLRRLPRRAAGRPRRRPVPGDRHLLYIEPRRRCSPPTATSRCTSASPRRTRRRVARFGRPRPGAGDDHGPADRRVPRCRLRRRHRPPGRHRLVTVRPGDRRQP